jgi:lipopolysaccharide/colanic/teichoic acid biosynthesis glycosyltransferase
MAYKRLGIGREELALPAPEVVGSLGSRRASQIRTSRLQGAGKRLLDVVVSASLLLVCLPLMAVLALAIVVESRGPVLYRARRTGHGGLPFDMVKFRKMRGDAPGPAVTTLSDARFTRIGRWLARTKLDELPQLWNVLRGQMSLVGPRPEAPSFVAARRGDYVTILGAKQGITGLSQLAFFEEMRILDADDAMRRYEEQIWPQKIALDQMYAERATLRWDLSILYWSAVSCLTRRPIAVDRQTGKLRLRRR